MQSIQAHIQSEVVAAPPAPKISRTQDAFASLQDLPETSAPINQPTTINSEIAKYIDFNCNALSADEAGNPLIFWKNKKQHFPLLSQLSRRIFNTQASSAQSERDASSARLTLSERRSRMSTDTIEKLELYNSFTSL